MATAQGPSGSMDIDLHIDENCDHPVAVPLLLKPPWRFVVRPGPQLLGNRRQPRDVAHEDVANGPRSLDVNELQSRCNDDDVVAKNDPLRGLKQDLACVGEQHKSKRFVANVVDGVCFIVANGPHGELEPVADTEGLLDVQRGFESAANGWRHRVAALDTWYDRAACICATIEVVIEDAAPRLHRLLDRANAQHELDERLLPSIVIVCNAKCGTAHFELNGNGHGDAANWPTTGLRCKIGRRMRKARVEL